MRSYAIRILNQVPLSLGPPVGWNRCLLCGSELQEGEERFRAEKDGKVGVCCKWCHEAQGEVR